jgi:molybdate transport system substrate-binding protein
VTPVPCRTAALLVIALVAAGCGGSSQGRQAARATGATGAPPPLAGTLTVLAASSLAESFGELGARFEAEHRGLAVSFNFAASSSLARQVLEGAPADVLATADEVTMGAAVEEGAVGPPTVFAHNRMEIVTRPGNPEDIADLAGLARSGLVVVLCAPEVPCGRSALQALARAGVAVRPASSEENVKAVLSKVTLGEADAGIVYVTDVVAAGPKVAGVPIPEAHNVVAPYPLAISRTTANPAAARAWVDFVLGPVGQQVLVRFGFRPAPS